MKIAVILIFLLVPVVYSGIEIHVPSDAPTIQAAIDLSSNGDTIIISNGLYSGEGNHDIEGRGKTIHVKSENGMDHCFIYGEDTYRAFYFHEQESNDTIIEGLTLMNCTGYRKSGGAVACEGASPTFKYCSFIYNQLISSYSSDELYGGAIYCDSSCPVVQECNFYGNTADIYASSQPNDYGGAISGIASQIKIYDSVFAENSSDLGGSIYVSSGSSLDVQRCSFRNGDVYSVTDCIVTISECDFDEGYCFYNDGMVTCLETQILISGCRISNTNETGLYTQSSNLILTDTIISGNGGSGFFSAGVVIHDSTAKIENCLIDHNEHGYPPEECAGGIVISNSNVDMVNCTLAENTGSESAGALRLEDSIVSIRNSIFWGNTPDQMYVFSGSQPTVSYSNIQGGYPGDSNKDLDPLFTSGSLGDYFLSQTASGQALNSPCLDAGNLPADEVCYQTVQNPGVCLDERSTRTDGITDQGIVDMGFHATFASNTPTPTPTPLNVKVAIEMPSTLFHPGDTCYCRAIVTNDSLNTLHGYPLFVILNAFGTLYFAPAFSTTVDHFLPAYPEFDPGATTVAVIPEFTWPEDTGTGDGILWYGILMNPELTQVCGEIGIFEFGWRESS